jgi:hypothetical protein
MLPPTLSSYLHGFAEVLWLNYAQERKAAILAIEEVYNLIKLLLKLG